MKKELIVLLAVMFVCGCSEKKEERGVQPVKVKTMVVGASHATGGQSYSGTIEEQSGSSLSFAGIGTVQSINVSEGQFVAKGQLIGALDATSARNAYEVAQATKEQALDAQERLKQLHDAGSLPEIKWVEVQTQVRQAVASEQIAKKGLTDTKLYAPFSGYVSQKNVEVGANVAPGVPVVRLVKIEQVKVKISVPEEEIARIKKGHTLTVSVPALGGRTFEARVSEKGVSADPLSRSYEVKAVIQNPKHELLPGMIAEVKASPNPSQGGDVEIQKDADLALPAYIIQLDADNKTFVWTVAEGKAQRAYVVLGENVGSEVVVAEGLHAGEKVIVEGQQKVSTGMRIEELKD